MSTPITGTFFKDYSFTFPNDNMIVSTSSVQEVPSNKLPLINLTINGLLKPSADPYILTISFPKDSPGPSKNRLSGAYGTFVIGNKVYNAEKIVKPAYDKTTRVLTIILDMKNTCYYDIKRVKRFSFSVQINDCPTSCTNTCSNTCTCNKLGNDPFCTLTGGGA